MIDLTKIVPGSVIRIKDGKQGVVRGSYMSTVGLVFTVKSNDKGIVQWNVPAGDIVGVTEKSEA